MAGMISWSARVHHLHDPRRDTDVADGGLPQSGVVCGTLACYYSTLVDASLPNWYFTRTR